MEINGMNTMLYGDECIRKTWNYNRMKLVFNNN